MTGTTWAAAAWGVVLLASWLGWGEAIRRWLAPAHDADSGLRVVWGASATVAVGGLLCLLGGATRPVLLVWTFGGVVWAARDLLARARRAADWRPRRWSFPLVAALVLAAGFIYAGAAAPNIPNPSDDWLAYIPFIKMIQQTGTFVDPFSIRRMGALGGQSYLQAMVQIVASDDRLALFDQGIALLLVVGLILGAATESQRTPSVATLVLLAVLLSIPELRINSASEMSGVAGFLAIYRTLVFVSRRGLAEVRAAALVALPAAAVCTLRQNYQLVVAALLGGLLLDSRGGVLADLRGRLKALAQTGGVMCALLVPWWVLAFRSNRTLLYPLYPGNADLSFAAITSQATVDERLHAVWSAVFHQEPIRALPLLLLGAPLVARDSHRGPLWGLVVGALLGLASLAASLPFAGNFTVARYYFGFVVALALASGLAGAEQVMRTRSTLVRVGISVVAFVLVIQVQRGSSTLHRNLDLPYARLTGPKPPPWLAPGGDEVRRMQEDVPAGERMLVMIERPYHLDYARNPILHLDLPGAASPRPGLPLGRGAEAIAEYLQSLGLRYFAFVRPDKAENELYRRAHWARQLTGRWRIWRETAPSFLHMLDAVDALAASRRRIHDDGHLVVVDLAAPAG